MEGFIEVLYIIMAFIGGIVLLMLIVISFVLPLVCKRYNKKFIDKAIQEYFKCQNNEYIYHDTNNGYVGYIENKVYEFKCSKNKPIKIVYCKEKDRD